MTSKPEIDSGVEGEGPALGQKVAERGGRLDTFDAPGNHTLTSYISDEVTALCPITSAPDWYTVEILLHKTVKLIESKSLKLYLGSFREKGMFAEAFADKIAQDVKRATGGSVSVEVTQKSRGGVSIVTTSEVD